MKGFILKADDPNRTGLLPGNTVSLKKRKHFIIVSEYAEAQRSHDLVCIPSGLLEFVKNPLVALSQLLSHQNDCLARREGRATTIGCA